ncbi:MAG: helix-turn-helix domain-containing protein, partial [Pseudomonadota bacterium]
MLTPPNTQAAHERLVAIERARRTVIAEGKSAVAVSGNFWQGRNYIEDSWQRCLHDGYTPSRAVEFDMVSPAIVSRTKDSNHALFEAGRPILGRIGRAIADTRYFAILTNEFGVVVDANGPIDRRDRRAELITRTGVDLSEKSIGTSAIGTALHQLQPVWLHRGEHFFAGLSHYSCAGAPVFNPDGQCAGMLDLTGIEQPERPELVHLVTQAARSIENMLTLNRPHALLVRINWPGRTLGDETDGLICLDGDGWVTGANSAARQMVQQFGNTQGHKAVHCSELFAMPYENLFNAARCDSSKPIDAPLWSGLRLNALALPWGQSASPIRGEGQVTDQMPLRDVEIAMIRKAIEDAKGNVVMAARMLGISRATVYRKLELAKRQS